MNSQVGDPEKPRLWLPVFGTAVAAMLVLAGLVIGLTWLFTGTWVWDYQNPADVADPEFFLPGALRSALLIVGGIVALVMAYRRQKYLEVDAAGARESARDAAAVRQAELAAERERGSGCSPNGSARRPRNSVLPRPLPGWLGCTRWPRWPTSGRTSSNNASTCCAPT